MSMIVTRRILSPASVAVLFTALAAILFDARAAAQEGGAFYVGGNYGYTLSTYGRTALNSAQVGAFNQAGYGLALAASVLHDKEAPWSADVGYMFSPYFSVEASYLELRTLRYFSHGTETSLFGSTQLTTTLKITSHGPTLAVVGVLPMTNEWYLNARAGAYESKTTTGYEFVVDTGPSVGSASENSTSLLLGAGTAYTLGAHWILRLDYVYLNHVGEKFLNKPFSVNLLTAGVAYAF
jgi:opacity protein-like surface antigen